MDVAPLSMLLSVMFNDTLRFIDNKVDPCDNFYHFACGNFAQEAPLGDGESSKNMFSVLNNLITGQLLDILELQAELPEPRSVHLLNLFYKSCMDVKSLDEAGFDPLKKLLGSFGEWPLSDCDHSSDHQHHWIEMEATLFRRLGFTTLFDLAVATDMRNTSGKIANLDQITLGMAHRDYYLNDSYSQIKTAYRQLLRNTSLELGANSSAIEQLIDELVEFETKLAQISRTELDRQDYKSDHVQMTVSALVENFTSIDFKTFFEVLKKHGWSHTDKTMINVAAVAYFQELPAVLATTSNRTIANFQMWMVTRRFLSSLSPRLQVAAKEFKFIETGQPNVDILRNLTCKWSVAAHFRDTLSYLYAKDYNNADAKQLIDRLITNLADVTKLEILENNWMDETTKKLAVDKLEFMLAQTGFPSYIMSETVRMENKNDIDFPPSNNYFDNVLLLLSSAFQQFIKKLNEPVNRNYWELGSFEADASADLLRNSIQVPLAALQYPLFSELLPSVINFGRIGYIIGHEITHHFDDQGRQFGANGSLSSWWISETEKFYDNGRNCFIGQYNSIRDDTIEMNVNGNATIGENIADNGGLRIAFRAYREWIRNGSTIDLIPEELKKFNSDQLFFISFAQTWCSNYLPEALRNRFKTDPHAPEMYRVNVPLQNFDEFAKSFQCTETHPMNPRKKCRIW